MGISQFLSKHFSYENRRQRKFAREHEPISAEDVDILNIDIDLQARLREQEEVTRKKVKEVVQRLMTQEAGHIAEEKAIQTLHDIAVVIYDMVHHDYARVSAAYIEEVENKLKDVYVQKRASIGRPTAETRRLIAEYQKKVLIYENLCKYLIEDFSKEMIQDDLDFPKHAIAKLKENTSSEQNPVLPAVINEGGRYGDL
jgi:uncharacterized protein YeeX (DUF496 family)